MRVRSLRVAPPLTGRRGGRGRARWWLRSAPAAATPVEWGHGGDPLARAGGGPDASDGTSVHRTLFAIAPRSTGLRQGEVPADAREGENSFGQQGYGGPCPPAGDHPTAKHAGPSFQTCAARRSRPDGNRLSLDDDTTNAVVRRTAAPRRLNSYESASRVLRRLWNPLQSRRRRGRRRAGVKCVHPLAQA
jgi:hypothetical protein